MLPTRAALPLLAATCLSGLSFAPPALPEEGPESEETPAAPPAVAPPVTIHLDDSFQIPQGDEAGGAGAPESISHTPAVAFSKDRSRMFTATSEGEVIVFDASTRKLLRRLRAGSRDELADAVAIDPEAGRVFWARKEKGITVVDVATGKVVESDEEIPARWLALAPGGRELAVASAKAIEVRDARSLARVRTLGEHESPVTNLAWSPDGRWIASTDEGGHLVVRDAANGKVLFRAKKEGALHAVAFQPGAQKVAYGGHDRRIYLADVEAGEEEILSRDFEQPYWITCLGFSPDGAKLAAGDESCDIWLYDVASAKRIFHNKHHVECWLGSVAWTLDNETMLFGCRPNSHAGKPAVYQALARAEAARSKGIRRSRGELLAAARKALSGAAEEPQRKALEALCRELEHEENPAVQTVALAGWPQAASVQTLSNVLTQSAAPAAQQAIQLCGAPERSLEALPPDVRKLAESHYKELDEATRKLQTSYFCVNQWKVKAARAEPAQSAPSSEPVVDATTDTED